jgi:hypothetical protein
MGTHISQVKSISLDSWTQDQVDTMQRLGNTISNYNYNPLRNWPLHDDDLTMERFIRDKYERKAFCSQRETANFTPIRSALKGGSKQSAPSASQEDVQRFQKELRTLGEMGFADRNRNIGVLKSVMGDVASATDVLVAMASSDGKEAPPKPQRPRVRFTEDTIGGLDTPQLQVGNPFAAWTGSQAEINPFSSIPPSLYKQQTQTGADTDAAAFFPPAAPLRPQLTGLPTPQQLDDAQTQAYSYTGRGYNQPQQQQQPFQQQQQQQQQQQPQQPFQQQMQPFQSQQQPQQGFSNAFSQDQSSLPQSNAPFGGLQRQNTGSAIAYTQQHPPPPPPPPRHTFQQQQEPYQSSDGLFAPLVPTRISQQPQLQQAQQQQAFGSASQGSNIFGRPSGPLGSDRTGVSPQATGPFGQTFTQPLQAELTGIQHTMAPQQQQHQHNNIFATARPNQSSYQISPQASGFLQPQSTSGGYGAQRPQGGYQMSPQMTGSQESQQQGLFANGQQQMNGQNHMANGPINGMQAHQPQPFGSSSQSSFPGHGLQQPFTGNGQQAGSPFAGQNIQQRVSSPFGQAPQQQPQQTGGFNPLQPFKTFDKASIMSLYNMGGQQQPQQQQQQQQQQQGMQPMRPHMTGSGQIQQQSQQQQYGGFAANGYGQGQGQAQPMYPQQQQQSFGAPQGKSGDWYS